MKRSVLTILTLLTALLTVPAQSAMAASTCRAPQLTGFSVAGPIHAGDKATGTVALSCAPRSRIQLSLTSDNANLTVPATVTVPRGRSSVAVPVTAKVVSGGEYVAHVTVTYVGQSVGGDVTVDPGLKLFEIPPTTEPNTVAPDVVFTGPAPAGGLTVRVASDNPAVTVPATASFQQGAVGGSIPYVTVHPVTKNTTVHLSVTLGTRTLRASTVLLPPFDGHGSMTISAEVPGDVYGLDDYHPYTVRLSNPAPDSGVWVSLKVADGNPAIELEENSVLITSGTVDTQFQIRAADVTRTVHTSIEASADGVTASIPVTVQPRLTAITNMPSSVQGGSTFQGTVNLLGPSDVDTPVTLQSNWGIVDVPVQVVIPAGSTSATFTATTYPVDSPSDVTITASLGDSRLDSTVTLTP